MVAGIRNPSEAANLGIPEFRLLLKKVRASKITILRNEFGQAIAEYAAMLGLLVAMLVTMKAIGRDANFIFRIVASMID